MQYSGADLSQIMTVSINGNNGPYDYTWTAPYWTQSSPSKNVFILLNIMTSLLGNEQIFVYLNTLYFYDTNGH